MPTNQRVYQFFLGAALVLVAARATEGRAAGVRVYATESTYWYEVPEGVETPSQFVEDGLVWQYDGQVVYTDAPVPHVPVTHWYSPADEHERTLAEALVGTERTDEYGRRWVLVDFDAETISSRVADYDQMVRATLGAEPEFAFGGDSPSSPTDDDPAWATDVYLTWHEAQCDGDEDPEINWWNVDSRIEVANPMSFIHRKVVLIWTWVGGFSYGQCSGTMVDDDTVLTAVHCLHDLDLNLYDPEGVIVCSRGNYQASAVCVPLDGTDPWDLSPDWDSGNIVDDYALLHLSQGLGLGYMALSTASDSVLMAQSAFTMGYPAYGPGCEYNVITSNDITIVDTVDGAYGLDDNGDHTHTPTGLVGTNCDAASGQSGSPIWYYPDGGGHFMTGILARHKYLWPLTDYNGGPKARTIRNWVIANM